MNKEVVAEMLHEKRFLQKKIMLLKKTSASLATNVKAVVKGKIDEMEREIEFIDELLNGELNETK